MLSTDEPTRIQCKCISIFKTGSHADNAHAHTKQKKNAQITTHLRKTQILEGKFLDMEEVDVDRRKNIIEGVGDESKQRTLHALMKLSHNKFILERKRERNHASYLTVKL